MEAAQQAEATARQEAEQRKADADRLAQQLADGERGRRRKRASRPRPAGSGSGSSSSRWRRSRPRAARGQQDAAQRKQDSERLAQQLAEVTAAGGRAGQQAEEAGVARSGAAGRRAPAASGALRQVAQLQEERAELERQRAR